MLFMAAYLLVFIPCALAFWIEYRTPPVTVGCRSMTILLYMVAQTVFICFSAWSHIKAFKAFRNDRWSQSLRHKWISIGFAIFILLPTWYVALFTTFAGTLMQITGIFQNCYCAATYTWSYRSSSTVSLATDTQDDRASSGLHRAGSSWGSDNSRLVAPALHTRFIRRTRKESTQRKPSWPADVSFSQC